MHKDSLSKGERKKIYAYHYYMKVRRYVGRKIKEVKHISEWMYVSKRRSGK